MEKLQKKLFDEMNTLHEESNFKKGHGMRDHTALVASKAISIAENANLTEREIMKAYISGLMHDIIQPEQTPIGGNIEKIFANEWGYNGQGLDDNEERESARFTNYYLNLPTTINMLNNFGVNLTKGDISEITNAIISTAGKMNPETGLYELNGESGRFQDLDRLAQITYLADKLTGTNPSLIFDGTTKIVALFTDKNPEATIYDYTLQKFTPHIEKREKFFGEVLKKDKIGNYFALNEVNKGKIQSGMYLQREYLNQIAGEIKFAKENMGQGQLFTCIKTIALAYKMTLAKIKEGDVRGIDGFDLIHEWYALGMNQAPNPAEAKNLGLQNCSFTDYINDLVQEQRRDGTIIEKTLLPQTDYTAY